MSGLLVGILEDFLGEHRKLNEDTGQVAFDCPACAADKGLTEGDEKGNLEVNYHMNKFKCWACHETNYMSGPVLKLLKKYANKAQIKNYLLLKPDADVITDKEHGEIIVTLPEGFKPLSECTSKDYKSDMALEYLRSRGITDEIIEEFGIGYTNKGSFYNRIIIPSYDSEGELNYFIARWFGVEYTKLKYINPVVEKQLIIFNEGKVNWDSTVYLVEGTTDHIVTPNSIPLLGKVISDLLLEKLHDNANAYVVILMDDDAFEDTKKLYKKLNFGRLYGKIRVIRCPEGYDPSKMFEKFGYEGMGTLLKSNYKPNF